MPLQIPPNLEDFYIANYGIHYVGGKRYEREDWRCYKTKEQAKRYCPESRVYALIVDWIDVTDV